MNPAEIQTLLQQGLQLHQSGQLEAAANLYQQILSAHPQHFDALHLMGVVALQNKQHEKSQTLFESAIQINPRHFHALNNYGNLLLEIGKMDESLAAFEKAIQINPQFFQAHFNRGNTLLELGRYHEAIESYQHCLKIDPQQPQIYYNLGNAQKELKEFDQAIQSYQNALRIHPNYKESFNNCGVAHKELKQYPEAEACYIKALAIDPQFAAAYCNQGILQTTTGQYQKAITSFDAAIQIQPAYAEAYNNRGTAFQELMQLDQALLNYQKAIDLSPNYADAHYNKAYVLLQQKKFAEGLAEHEWRKELPTYLKYRPLIQKPLWQADVSLEGKTILVFCEQGLGDTTQFSRFVEPLSKLAAKVIFAVPKPLLSLLAPPNERVTIVDEKQLPTDFDYYCPLLSLPHCLRVDVEGISSAKPSLTLDGNKVDQWQAHLGPKKQSLRVGITWSGNPDFKKDHLRSFLLKDFLKCLPEQGIEYLSLQQVIRPRDQDLANQCTNIQFVQKEIKDFSDTAALIQCVDLVVTSCTSIAHLAGSLGKPCWVIIPFAPDWKWFTDSASSPWYPSVKLFRQTKPGDWDSALSAVRHDLSALAHSTS